MNTLARKALAGYVRLLVIVGRLLLFLPIDWLIDMGLLSWCCWIRDHFLYEYRACGSISETLAYRKAQETGTPEGYRHFLETYPNGYYSDRARSDLQFHMEWAQKEKNYLFNELAQEANCSVQIDETNNGYRLLIKSHLVEGYSVSDSSPYVKWLYDSRESLLRKVNERICEILKKLFVRSTQLAIDRVVVELTHGIRSETQDVPTTIYSASIEGRRVKNHTRQYVTHWQNSKIVGLLSVRINMIPQLYFQYESRRR